MKPASIFFLGEDDDTRRLLKRNLRNAGYRILVAEDVEDALERAGGGIARADLILLDLVVKTAEEALLVGRRIREQAKYDGHTPLVVMAEEYGKDVEGTEASVADNDWVFYLGGEPNQLRNLLARLTS
jgi:DNA-binding response OmpR family regulator